MKNKTLITISVLFFGLSGISPLLGQDAGGADPHFYDRLMGNGLLLFAAAVVIGAVLAIFHLLNVVVKMQQLQIYQENGLDDYLEAVKAPKEPLWRRLYRKWTNVVPVEKEQDIMFDHAYDGIRELDNSLPPWWVAMFYISIIVGVVYFSYYHIFQYGPSSAEAYEMEMQQAEEDIKAFMATQADQIDENNVTLLSEENQLAIGKSIYDANCLVCHGAQGEGGVGPNFADAYWIHGGSINDLFRTIKYGVPEKGMIAWSSQLRPSEMQQVASFILGMQGTNPPNQKAPQGELYKADAAQPESDTTSTENESNGTIGMLQK